MSLIESLKNEDKTLCTQDIGEFFAELADPPNGQPAARTENLSDGSIESLQLPQPPQEPTYRYFSLIA